LKAELEQTFPGVEVELIKSSGGAFEITVDGNKIFSKLDIGRFPEKSEIVNLINK
jgi:selenoprotein W-related protein